MKTQFVMCPKLKVPSSVTLNLTLLFIAAVEICGSGNNRKEYFIKEYCENEEFAVECEGDSVILINYGRYGRIQGGRCITSNYGKLGCDLDVVGYLDRECSGEKSCNLVVSTVVPDDEQPCPKDFRSYLAANHTCTPVISGSSRLCQAPSHIRVGASSGFLASHVTSSTGLGSLDCPWLIEVADGQKVRITLYDFGWKTITTEHVCHVYAIIKETAASTSKTVCAGKDRITHAYTSTSNIVEVRLVVKSNNNIHSKFMLYFEAIGCEILKPPINGWIRQDGNTAVVGCSTTDFTWEFRCYGHKWVGENYTCSTDPVARGSRNANSGLDISSGISIVVIILIAVAIGASILIFGLVCLRRQTRQRHSHHPAPLTYDACNKLGKLNTGPHLYDAYMDTGNSYSWHSPPLPSYNDQRRRESMYNTNMNSTDNKYQDDIQDHIYESPKFVHRNISADDSDFPPPPPAMYYEVDPTAISNEIHIQPNSHYPIFNAHSMNHFST